MTAHSGQRLRNLLDRIAWRITTYRLARRLSRGVLFCSVPATLVLVASRVHPLPHAVPAGAFLLLCGFLWGLLEGWKCRSTLVEAALFTDRRLALEERLPTALETGSSSPLGAALLDEAWERIRNVEPRKIGSFAFPWEPLALLPVLAGILALVSLAPPRTGENPAVSPTTPRVQVQVRAIRNTVQDIEQRFPEAGDEVTRSLEEIAGQLAGATGEYTETGQAMSRLGKKAEKEASKLEDSEEALSAAVERAALPGGETLPAEGSSERERISKALRDLASDSNLSQEGSRAAEEALAALEGGDGPAYLANAGRLEEDLERIRQTRMALEAASLRMKASWEKLRWAFEDDKPTKTVGKGKGNAAPPDSGKKPGGSSDLGAFRESLASRRWNPVYDDVVKRYFAAIGGETSSADPIRRR